MIEFGTGELADQVAVPAMNHDDIHSCPFHTTCGVGKQLHDFFDFLSAHLLAGNRIPVHALRPKDLIIGNKGG